MQAQALFQQWKTPFIINQRKYSMLERGIETEGLKEYAAKNGIGIIAFCPLAQGLLTEKYKNEIPKDSRIRTDGRFLKEHALSEEYRKKVGALSEIAAKRGQSLAQMALSWVLRDGEVTSVLIGASKAEQIRENVQIVSAEGFTEEELKQIEGILEGN